MLTTKKTTEVIGVITVVHSFLDSTDLFNVSSISLLATLKFLTQTQKSRI